MFKSGFVLRFCYSGSESGLLNWVEPYLTTDVCYLGHQDPDPEVIQGYVKKVRPSLKVHLFSFKQRAVGQFVCYSVTKLQCHT